MAEHVHGCLSCRPDMVPDFDQADPRYHSYEKCGVTLNATVDGVAPGYHAGVFEGADGWVLLACEGFDAAQVHACPTCTTYTVYEGYDVIDHYEKCLTPRFGTVEVIHDCPSDLKARVARLEAALKPLVSEADFWRAVFGRDVS